MSKVHILVEGQTEDEFVREILGEYLSPKGIYLSTTIAKTKRAIGGNPAFRGGVVSYGKIEFDVKRLVHDSSASLVTTMIDFYRLPSDFPGFNDREAKKGTPLQCVTYLENKFRTAINHPKFLPYISVHEFEALLFTDPDIIVREVRGEDEKTRTALHTINKKYNSPEDINQDHPPSKRILEYLTEYEKILHGILIAVEIGVEQMREKCPHFHEWLTKIENLATQ